MQANLRGDIQLVCGGRHLRAEVHDAATQKDSLLVRIDGHLDRVCRYQRLDVRLH